MLAAVFSALHLLALALGLPGVFLRGRALKGPLDEAGLKRLFAADTVWGFEQPETYRFVSSQPGHEAAGMWGTLIVR